MKHLSNRWRAGLVVSTLLISAGAAVAEQAAEIEPCPWRLRIDGDGDRREIALEKEGALVIQPGMRITPLAPASAANRFVGLEAPSGEIRVFGPRRPIEFPEGAANAKLHLISGQAILDIPKSGRLRLEKGEDLVVRLTADDGSRVLPPTLSSVEISPAMSVAYCVMILKRTPEEG